jgi:hypothetical protein
MFLSVPRNEMTRNTPHGVLRVYRMVKTLNSFNNLYKLFETYEVTMFSISNGRKSVGFKVDVD